MPANKKSLSDANQEQRDKINRMDFTIAEVLQPALKRVETTLLTIEQRDYLTRAEADTKYMTKADFRPYAVVLGTIATITVAAIVAALLKGVVK